MKILFKQQKKKRRKYTSCNLQKNKNLLIFSYSKLYHIHIKTYDDLFQLKVKHDII